MRSIISGATMAFSFHDNEADSLATSGAGARSHHRPLMSWRPPCRSTAGIWLIPIHAGDDPVCVVQEAVDVTSSVSQALRRLRNA